jgi:hypothetical protein
MSILINKPLAITKDAALRLRKPKQTPRIICTKILMETKNE